MIGHLDDLEQFIDAVENGDPIGQDEIEMARAALDALQNALKAPIHVSIHDELLPHGVSAEDIAAAVFVSRS